MRDLYVVDGGPQRYAISLGVFRTAEAANGRADSRTRPASPAPGSPRTGGIVQTLLVVREPPAPALARLRELAPAYPGTEVRVGTCERAS